MTVEVLAVLRGARVRRADVPEQGLVALTLALDRASPVLLISVLEGAAGIGIVEERPRGEPAASFAQLLRKHLVGAEVERVDAVAADEIVIALRREDARASLHLAARRRGPGLVLADASGRRLGGIPHGVGSVGEPHGAPDREAWPRDLDELRAAGAALLARRSGQGETTHDAELRRTLIKQRARLVRRADAIARDLEGTAAAPRLRADGNALLAAAAAVPARASEVVLADLETGAPRRIALDPALTAIENAERAFAKARKLDRGAAIATGRLADARAELARHDAAIEALARGDATLGEMLVGRRAPARSPEPEGRRRPYRTFVLEDGTTLLVGRGARDNDALTFRHAAPDDRFFHARGLSGAHVILRGRAGREPSEDAMTAAALLAAHFSGSRGDLAADVSCAARRDLRRGKAPGSVILRASTTRRVRMDQDAIAALLAREVATGPGH